MPLTPDDFISRCVSVDLEVDPKSARLFAFGAVRGGERLSHRTGPRVELDAALDRLEAFCTGAAHLVGHNILRHDLPHLAANRARLAGLGAAPVDTLWLNPLAFPRTPTTTSSSTTRTGGCRSGMSTIRSRTRASHCKCCATRSSPSRAWARKARRRLPPITS